MSMAIKLKAIAIAACAVLLMPLMVQADVVGGEEEIDMDAARMKTLEDRLRSLEDRLSASEATVAKQNQILKNVTPDVAEGGGLDDFLNGLVWGGYVDASYMYNFNNPDTNGAGGTSVAGGQAYRQFHTEHNTFSLDAVKLELGKPTDGHGTAGFQLDLLFGENANILSAAGDPVVIGSDGRTAGVRNPGDQNVFVQEAYVAYNYEGVDFQLGKFETLLGYEVLDTPYNPNITHGFLFTFAIPLYHTGALASGTLGENFNWAAGVVNGFNNASDFNDNKALLGRVGFEQDNLSVTFNTFIGKEQVRTGLTTGTVESDNSDLMTIYDLVATFDLSEQTHFWANADYGREEFSTDTVTTHFPVDSDAEWYGIAAGVKHSISEKLDVAVRGEWFRDDGGTRLIGCTGNFPAGTAPPCAPAVWADEIDAYSATVTLGYQLADNLKARAEFRHDRLDGQGSTLPAGVAGVVFPKDGGGFDDQQSVGLVEVTYSFD